MAGKCLNIQVAFQGGGARIFALIAAAEALKGFEREGRVKVTRIAGTSAGAIVGTLYAAGVEPGVMRSEFGSFPVKKIMTRLPPPIWFSSLVKAAFNLPLAKSALLEGLLTKLLKGPLESKDLVFSSLAIPAIVVATDVGNRCPKVYKDYKKGEKEPLISAMLDSCAIPFFFRTASSSDRGRLILDGGLWANLPSDELDQMAELGPIVAISFADAAEAATPKSSYELAKALLDTAIESSVVRARNRTGLHVIRLNTYGISTFDFEKAQGELVSAGPVYEGARRETRDRLEDLIEESDREAQVVLSNIWKGADVRMMERLHRVYKSQGLARPFKYLRHLVTIQADSLVMDDDRKAQDVLTQILRFRPAATEIDFILLSLSVADKDEIGVVSCSVTEGEGRNVPFEYFPANGPEGPGLLIAFTPPLKQGAGDFQVRVRYKIRESMPFLKKGERDEIKLTAERADGTVDHMEFVLLVPEAFGRVRVEAPLNERRVHPGKPWDLDEVTQALVPEGFHPYGWAGEQVPGNLALKAYFAKEL